MLGDFFRILMRLAKFKAGSKLVGRFFLLQTYDIPKKQYDRDKKRKMYKFNHGIVAHLILNSYVKQSSKKQFNVEEAHTIHLDHGSDSFTDIQTVISEDILSERCDDFDFDFVQLDSSVITDSL